MRKTLLTLAALALVASPALAGKFNKKLTVGDKAPSFEGIPAVMNKQDASLTLSDVKDDVVVLVFLANHCPAVVAQEDRIIDLANTLKGKPVKVVGVAVTGGGQRENDNLPMIKKRVEEKGYNFVYGFDESQKIGRDYGATNTPTFFVLDKDRKVRYMGTLDDSPMNEQKVTKHYVQDAVNALLAGKDVEVSETRPAGCGIQYEQR